MAIDLTARPTVKIPPAKSAQPKGHDSAKSWARTVTSVPVDASTGTDWEGEWLARGSSVDLPVGSLFVACDVDGGRYDAFLRVVLPDGKHRILAGSASKAWAQELRCVARQWLAMSVRDRILVAAKKFVDENRDDADPIVIAKIEARRQWIAALESPQDVRLDAIARIREIMAEHGLSIQDLA